MFEEIERHKLANAIMNVTSVIWKNSYRGGDDINYAYPVVKIEELMKKIPNHSFKEIQEDELLLEYCHLSASFLATWGAIASNVQDLYSRPASIKDLFTKENAIILQDLYDKELKLFDLDENGAEWKIIKKFIKKCLNISSVGFTTLSKIMHLTCPRLFIPMDIPVRLLYISKLKNSMEEKNKCKKYTRCQHPSKYVAFSTMLRVASRGR